MLRVKLNNPLMGTETKIDIDILQLYGIHLVKLNDPQMGTETPLTVDVVILVLAWFYS